MVEQRTKQELRYQYHITSSINALICTEIAIRYFNDTSMALVALAMFIQIVVLSRNGFLQFEQRLRGTINGRFAILLLLLHYLLSIFLHVAAGPARPPQSDDIYFHERYLHGGVTIEYIGELPLQSKIPLLIWDTVIFVLQLVSFEIMFPLPREEPPPDPVTDDDENEDAGTSSQAETSSIERNKTALALAYSGNAVVTDVVLPHIIAGNWRRYPVPQEEPPHATDTPTMNYDINEAGNMV